MNTQKRQYCMWAVGIEASDLERIHACMDENHRLEVLPDGMLPTLQDADRDEPVLLWMGQRFWRRVERREGSPFRFLEHIPRVLVLPASCSCADLEEALDDGFQDVLRGTESPEKIHKIVRRSLEMGNVFRDMERMTREILMHRELLTRKSDVFSFLQNFIIRVSKSDSRLTMLNEARDVLSELFPVAAMHAALWGPELEGSVSVHLCLDAASSASADPAIKAWTELLLSTAKGLVGSNASAPKVTVYFRGGEASLPPAPDTRRIFMLPLSAGERLYGVLALLLTREMPLGRDQVLALDAATTHLAARLRSAEPAQQAVPGLPIAI